MSAIGTAGQTGTHLRCVSRPVPLLSLSGFGTHRDNVPQCPVPSRPHGGSRPNLPTPGHAPHNFFFASFTSRKGSNDAATTRRKWAIYDFVPRTSASHTEGICLQKTNSYGSF